MTPESLAIIAIVVSALSLFVSGGCLFVAYAAKQQAKNAAMLKQRNEAIAHLRAALSALKEHRAVTNAAAQNITKPRRPVQPGIEKRPRQRTANRTTP